jgi:phosphate/sulfate permease
MIPKDRGSLPPEVRWTVGCLVASAAIVGSLVLVFLVVLALEPPTWAQVLIGVGLALGGATLAWLIAAALGKERS